MPIFQALMVCLALCVGSAAEDRVWDPVSDHDQLDSLVDDGARVLLSFSVPWCLGCVRMDREVWGDPAFAHEIRTHAKLARVDESLLQDASDRFGVEGFPVLVLIEDGEEIARLSGYRDQETVLGWVQDPRAKDDPIDAWTIPIGLLYDKAIDAVFDERKEDAAELLCVFWVRSVSDQQMTDTLRWLRRDRHLSLLTRVAQEPAGRERLLALVDQFPRAGPDAHAPQTLVHDWVVLLMALGESDRLDAWIDRGIEAHAGHGFDGARERVFDRLVERGMWSQAGQVLDERVWNRWVCRARGEATGDPVHDAMPDRVVAKERAKAPATLEAMTQALEANGRIEEAALIRSVL